ncbi:HAD family hydrolase [Candidatus Lariskella endosymbiont of Hedychridium roseum]|uniref:HAD family hydrolase n=1 Tax=Candidatus Lariskella endosymbiont of Hedychridium roseum TaxID=3077949 RepID=UPI0030D5556B
MIQQFKLSNIDATKPEIVIFDWDDTLIKSGNIYQILFEKVMRDLNSSDSVRAAREYYRHYSLNEAFPMIFGDDWKKARDLYYNHLSNVDLSNIEVMEHAEDVLKHMQSEDLTMLIVSNKNGNVLRDEVKRIGWEKYFTGIVGASDAKRDKPWPDPAQLALSAFSFSSPEKVWFVGDSIVDAKCAHSISAQFVLFGDQNTQKDVDNAMVPYLYVADHKELILLHNMAK